MCSQLRSLVLICLFLATLAYVCIGCAGLQDTRAERLDPVEIEQLQAQRIAPEKAGFSVVRSGSEVIGFRGRTWVDGDASVTLPMVNAMDRGESHVIVEATLNDERPVPMMVDTGAEADVLTPSLVEKLQLPLFNTGRTPLMVRGIGGQQRAFASALRTMRLGGVAIHNSLVVVLTEQYRNYPLGMFRGSAVDTGILGLNSLRRFRYMTIDWRRRTVTLSRQGDYQPDSKMLVGIVPFRVVGGKLFVDGSSSFSGVAVPISFALDTGSDDAVMFPPSIAQRLDLVRDNATRQRWLSGLGGYHVGMPFVAGSVQIGRLKFVKVAGHTVPEACPPLFGNKLMRYYKTTFDFTRRQLVFEKK